MPPRGTRARRRKSPSQESTGALHKANEAWIESQATLFEHFDEMARRWLDRRREALDATRRSIEEMRKTGDMGELLRIQQEWLVGSMRRLSADLKEFSQAAFDLPQRAVRQLGNSAEEAAQEAGPFSGDATGSKPS